MFDFEGIYIKKEWNYKTNKKEALKNQAFT